MKINTWKVFFDSIIIAFGLTSLSYIVGYYAGWITEINWLEVNWLEVFAVWTSYSCTYMCVKQSRFNYPMGAISTIAYSLLFYYASLYASAALNAYLAPVLLYGWFRWRSDNNTRPVTLVEGKWWPVYIVISVFLWGIITAILQHFDANLPLTDSVILVGTILAQFLLDNKKIETWVIWFIVDVIAIWEYSVTGLYLVAFQYVFFLLNTGWGFYDWYKSMRKGI